MLSNLSCQSHDSYLALSALPSFDLDTVNDPFDFHRRKRIPLTLSITMPNKICYYAVSIVFLCLCITLMMSNINNPFIVINYFSVLSIRESHSCHDVVYIHNILSWERSLYDHWTVTWTDFTSSRYFLDWWVHILTDSIQILTD